MSGFLLVVRCRLNNLEDFYRTRLSNEKEKRIKERQEKNNKKKKTRKEQQEKNTKKRTTRKEQRNSDKHKQFG